MICIRPCAPTLLPALGSNSLSCRDSAKTSGFLDRPADLLPVGQRIYRIAPVIDVEVARSPPPWPGAPPWTAPPSSQAMAGRGIHLVDRLEAVGEGPQEHVELALAAGIRHHPEGAHHFVLVDLGARGRRCFAAADLLRHLAEADLLARQLAVVDGRILCGLLVGRLGIALPAQSFE